MLFDEARSLVEKALEIHVKANGKNSIEEAIDRRLLSVIFSGLEEHEKALEEQLAVKTILGEKNLGSKALFVEIAVADMLKIPWEGLTMQFLLLRRLSPI